MMKSKTLQAVVDEEGNVTLLEPIQLESKHRAMVTILDEQVGEQESALRPYGLAKGKFVVPDDFNAPLPDDILDDFDLSIN